MNKKKMQEIDSSNAVSDKYKHEIQQPEQIITLRSDKNKHRHRDLQALWNVTNGFVPMTMELPKATFFSSENVIFLYSKLILN